MPGCSDRPAAPIDAALVRRLIEKQFPHWAGLPVRAVEPGGWDNRSFRLGGDMAGE
jgi:aminoglycoside phosphotransferase (APT) family kinase protein